MMDSNIINTLRLEAKNSLIDHQLAATLVKGKKMITKPCCNTTRGICRGKSVGSLHAEANALFEFYGKSLSYDKKNGWIFDNRIKSNLNLIVVRIDKHGNICNARPCYNCLNMMKAVGIRRVYYSINADNIICENVKDMISIQLSSVDKYINQLSNSIYIDHNTYYENLLIKYFPKIIKKFNLDIFIQYNLSNILPEYKVIIDINKNKPHVLIMNTSNKIIIKAHIIM